MTEAQSLSPRVVIGGLLGLTALIYLPALGYGFVYDDGWTLLSNGFLRAPDASLLFSPEGAAKHVPDAFRPTLVAFDVLAFRALGNFAPAHHALSILLHLGVCLALARWLARLGAGLMLRASTVALFGVLAIHAEPVTVVSFREDLLAALLGLTACSVATRTIEGSTRTWTLGLLAAALAMALAGGAKLSAAALPGLWLLAQLLSPWRPRAALRRIVSGFAVLQAAAVLSAWQTSIVFGSFSPYGADNPRVLATRIDKSAVLAESTRIHVDYLSQMVLPFGLSPEHVDRGAQWSDPSVLLATAVLGLLLGVGGWAVWRRRPVIGLAVLGSFWLALPTSNLFGMPNMQADRLMYLPSAAVCLGLAALALSLGRRARGNLRMAPIVVLCIVQGTMARAQSSVYASNATMWKVALERAPESARTQAMAGLTLLRQTSGRELPDEDVLTRVSDHCDRALTLDARYELGHVCHARLALLRKDWPTAYRHFERAVELSPDRNDRNLAALAQLSLDLPDRDSEERLSLAYGHLARGLREYPYSPEIRVTAGRIAHRTGLPWLALHLYRGARRLRPDRWETVIAGVELALDLGDAAAAQRTWLQAHELIGKADPTTRSAISARIVDLNRLYPAPLLHSLLDPGVFPDDP